MPFPPPNPTTNPAPDSTRHVVIEPPKPSQTRLKQYIAVKYLKIDKQHSAKAHELVWLTEETALPFVSSHLLVPIDVAIREGLYPPIVESAPEKVADKIKQAVKEVMGTPETTASSELPAETNPPTEPPAGTKSLLGNKLRDAVQVKKSESQKATSEVAKIDAAKLAAIKAGGKAH